MQKGITTNCKVHYGQKLKRLCKDTGCWVKICLKCANTSHKGHNVIEWNSVIQDANTAKDKLLQAKRGDLITIKRILDGMNSLEVQLNESREKRQINIKKVQENVLAQINKIVEDSELEYNNIKNKLYDTHKGIKEVHDSLVQEINKLPALTDAVLSKGTADDLKIFFEMCKKGSETNAEIFYQKKNLDNIKQTIEDFTVFNPLPFNFDKLLEEEGMSFNGLAFLSEDKSELNNSVISSYKSLEDVNFDKKTIKNINSSISMKNKRNTINASFTTSNKEKTTNNIGNQSLVQSNKNRSYSSIKSKYGTLSESKKTHSKKPSVNSSNVESVTHKKKPSQIPKLKATIPKNTRGKSSRFPNPPKINTGLIKAKTSVNELRTAFSSMAELISSNMSTFSDMSAVIKEIIDFLREPKVAGNKKEMLKRFAAKILESAMRINNKQYKELCKC